MKKLVLLAFIIAIFGKAYAENQGVESCSATLDGEERISKQVDENGNVKLDTPDGSGAQQGQ